MEIAMCGTFLEKAAEDHMEKIGNTTFDQITPKRLKTERNELYIADQNPSIFQPLQWLLENQQAIDPPDLMVMRCLVAHL